MEESEDILSSQDAELHRREVESANTRLELESYLAKLAERRAALTDEDSTEEENVLSEPIITLSNEDANTRAAELGKYLAAVRDRRKQYTTKNKTEKEESEESSDESSEDFELQEAIAKGEDAEMLQASLSLSAQLRPTVTRAVDADKNDEHVLTAPFSSLKASPSDIQQDEDDGKNNKDNDDIGSEAHLERMYEEITRLDKQLAQTAKKAKKSAVSTETKKKKKKTRRNDRAESEAMAAGEEKEGEDREGDVPAFITARAEAALKAEAEIEALLSKMTQRLQAKQTPLRTGPGIGFTPSIENAKKLHQIDKILSLMNPEAFQLSKKSYGYEEPFKSKYWDPLGVDAPEKDENTDENTEGGGDARGGDAGSRGKNTSEMMNADELAKRIVGDVKAEYSPYVPGSIFDLTQLLHTDNNNNDNDEKKKKESVLGEEDVDDGDLESILPLPKPSEARIAQLLAHPYATSSLLRDEANVDLKLKETVDPYQASLELLRKANARSRNNKKKARDYSELSSTPTATTGKKSSSKQHKKHKKKKKEIFTPRKSQQSTHQNKEEEDNEDDEGGVATEREAGRHMMLRRLQATPPAVKKNKNKKTSFTMKQRRQRPLSSNTSRHTSSLKNVGENESRSSSGNGRQRNADLKALKDFSLLERRQSLSKRPLHALIRRHPDDDDDEPPFGNTFRRTGGSLSSAASYDAKKKRSIRPSSATLLSSSSSSSARASSAHNTSAVTSARGRAHGGNPVSYDGLLRATRSREGYGDAGNDGSSSNTTAMMTTSSGSFLGQGKGHSGNWGWDYRRNSLGGDKKNKTNTSVSSSLLMKTPTGYKG